MRGGLILGNEASNRPILKTVQLGIVSCPRGEGHGNSTGKTVAVGHLFTPVQGVTLSIRTGRPRDYVVVEVT